MKATSWVALAGLVGLGAFVVWSSFDVGGVRCEICIEFAGGRACRAVDGATEGEARAAARTNACAQLTSGVTNMMACERSEPALATCRTR
jgi:hypothetical protein